MGCLVVFTQKEIVTLTSLKGLVMKKSYAILALLFVFAWAHAMGNPAPNRTLLVSALIDFSTATVNTTVGPRTFTITGINLTADNVSVGAVSGFSYSTDIAGTYTSSLTLTQAGGAYLQVIYVKFSPTTIASYNGNITVSGGGAVSKVVAAIGRGISSTPTLWGMTSVGGANNNGVMFKYIASSNTYTKVYDMVAGNGFSPMGGLTMANDGNFYGMTKEGGADNSGTIFQYNPNTNVYTKKIDLTELGGSQPYGSLTQAIDGNLYGMTKLGGQNFVGVIFQYNPTTNTYTKKIDLEAINGSSPNGSLLQASDGNLYGMTAYGGALNLGVIFQYNPVTNTYMIKHEFNGLEGSSPMGSLIQASDGYLYGMTSMGGENDLGVIFQYNFATNTFAKKKYLNGNEGSEPNGALLEATDGFLYGMGLTGGIWNMGTIFQYDPSYNDLFLKEGFGPFGYWPKGDLMLAGDGHLYGMTQLGGVADEGVIFKYNIADFSYTSLYGFTGTTGGTPMYGSLLQYDGIEEVSAVTITATAGTPGPSGYPTLKDAFDKINDGTHKGAITVKINSNTTETASAVLNPSLSGTLPNQSNYTKVNIFPTVTGLSISGNLDAPLIDLNGADHVTIDGRVNATGSAKDLAITNTSVSTTLGTSTLRFFHDASYNTVKYCTIKGSSTATTGGVLFFYQSETGTTGNSGNSIDSNNITNAGSGNRPRYALFSEALAINNSLDTISNNNFYDFLNPDLDSKGIFLSNNTTAWTITGNSFYETTTIAPTAANYYSVINIDNTDGNDFNVINNIIGGNAEGNEGTFTIDSDQGYSFKGIYISAGSTTVTNIQGNTIKNIAITSAAPTTFVGINILNGNVNVGTQIANTIGSTTGTGSIVSTNSTVNAFTHGIYSGSSGIVNIEKNKIGSITTIGSATISHHLNGIITNNNTGTTTIRNNAIGGTDVANSMNASSATTGFWQGVSGISCIGGATTIISDNTIANMTNNTTVAYGTVIGINTSGGIFTISNNTIKNLSIGSATSFSSYGASVIGIYQASTAANQSITGNTIYNLSNTNEACEGGLAGIIYNGGNTGINMVEKNFIYDLSVNGSSSSAGLYGIKIMQGTTSYSNNIISLNGNNRSFLYGIYDGGGTNNIHFNTVYFYGSTPVGTDRNSFCLYSFSNNVRNYKNNIFVNNRISGAANSCVFISNLTNLTIDYNDYYCTGGGTQGVGMSASQIYTSLADFKDYTRQQVNSKNADPHFAIAGDTLATSYMPSDSSLVAATGTGIITDFGGADRSLLSPAMGAWEHTVSNCFSPSISSHPSTNIQLIGINGTATALSVTASAGSGTISNYQWYSNVIADTIGGTIVGTNSASYTPLTNTVGTLYYYCIVSNSSGCSTISNVSGGITILVSTSFVSFWTLPTNYSSTTAASIPSNRDRYQRATYLITAAEMLAGGFLSGFDINSISYLISEAGDASQNGAFKIYLMNTTDLTYSINTNWNVSGFTKVSDIANWAVPIAEGPYEVPFSGGSAFTYTGGGVYVAWEFRNPSGSTGIDPLMGYCNTTIDAQLYGYHSSTSMSSHMDVSDFRPATKFGTSFYTDIIELNNIYTLAHNPIPYGAPTHVEVNLKNISELPYTFDVTLTVKDPTNIITRYTTTQTVTNLAAHDSIVLDFPAWNPSIQEEVNITATASGAEFETWTANNTLTTPCSVNDNLYSYQYTNDPQTCYGFSPIESGIFAAKFSMNGRGKISGAKLFIYNYPTNLGKTIYAVAINSAGVVVDRSADYTITAEDLGTNKSFSFPSPPIFTDEIFYVGLAQLQASEAYYPMGVSFESPPRSNTFYVFDITGGSPFPVDFMPCIEAIVTSAPCSNPLVAGIIAGAQTICFGDIPEEITSTSLPTGHSGDLEYKWQYSTTNSISNFFDIIPAETNATYAPAAITVTTWYKRLSRVACKTDWTNAPVSNVEEVTVQFPSKRYVTQSGAGIKNGKSWSTAYDKGQLQSAINELCVNEVWVAAGTYYPTTGLNRSISFSLKDGVAVYGGFAGTETLLSERNVATNVTTLSGDIGNIAYANDNVLHVFYHPATLALTNTAVLDGFTITGGYADGSGTQGNGAGMFNEGCSPSLLNCKFSGNTAKNGGALFATANSNVSLINCYASQNQATELGGGAFWINDGCSFTLINSLVYDNTSPVWGGGILLLSNATATLTNCTFSQNASSLGGGLYNAGGTFLINNSILWGNTASQWGNQIETSGGISTTLNNSCFSNTYVEPIWDVEGLVIANACINTIPRFVNTALNDFRITGNSACLDAGNNAFNAQTTDIRGNIRIQSSNIDMGAYEYTQGTDPAYTDVFVKQNASGSNNGHSWADAFTSLQSALDLPLAAGDKIWVAAGFYYPESSYDLDPGKSNPRLQHFRMLPGVAIYGSLAGDENVNTYNLSLRNFASYQSVLSGNIGAEGDSTDNCYHVFYHPEGLNLSASALLDGFEIRAGLADGEGEMKDGGGMFNNYNSPSLQNCIFSRNSASDRGGAIYNTNSNPVVRRVHFQQNRAEIDGGGVFNNNSSSPSFTSCGFSQNYAGLSGGAIYTKENSFPTLTNCLLVYNIATYGGASLSQSAVSYTNCTFSKNTAYQGGGLHNESDASLNNCILWANEAVDGKQLFIKAGTTTTINKSNYSALSYDISNFGTMTGLNNIFTNPAMVNVQLGDFRLGGNSPCADAGDNSACIEPYDIRDLGFGRKLNKTTGLGGGIIDMGAYEYLFDNDPEYGCTNPLLGGSISQPQNICYNATPQSLTSFTLPSGQHGFLNYKWQKSTTNSTTGFDDITNSNSGNYSPGSLTVTTWYKRIARVNCMSDWVGAAESNVIQITVYPTLTSAISPELTPLCYNEAAASYTASGTGGTGSYTYLWYKNNVSTGITTDTYSPGDTNANATFYCAVTSGSCGTVNTPVITIIEDITAPVISDCPSDITVSTGAGNPGCTQTATWPVPSATDVCTGVTGFTSSRARGSAFTVGTTTVVYTALDLAGNASTCHFTVTVTDNTLPIISCNPNITTGTDPGANYATVNYICTATDNCSTPEMKLLSGLASGALFPLGTTTVSWQATDLAGNTAVCSFTVTVSGLNGNCTVGVGGTFPTLTGVNGLFQTINTYGICGDVTASIISNITEPGIFALNQWGETGEGDYHLIIRPASASEKTLQGNFSLALIRMNGADRVQFDGSYAGGRYLKFRNNSTLAPTFSFANGSTFLSLENCTIEGSNNTATSGVVAIGAASSSMANMNLAFVNNVFQPATIPPANYIYAAGTAARPNNSIMISSNEFKNFKSNGVYVTATGNGNNWTMVYNTIYNNVTATAAQTAINFIPGLTSSDNNIAHNNIGGSSNSNTGTWTNSAAVTFKGISVNAAYTDINANRIQNVNLSNSGQLNFMGIELIGGAAMIRSNVVGSELTENSISLAGLANFFGIRSVSTSTNVGISGNLIANITNTCIAGYPNFYGLYAKGGAITENEIFNFGTSTTTANPAVFGIEVLGINGSIAYCVNNMVALKGGNALNPKIFGIQDNGYSATANLPIGHYAHNSVEISGNATTCSKTFAFQRNYNSVILLANNIFSNKRSNSPVGHYAIGSANTTAWTSNNNDLFVSSSKLGAWGNSDKANLATWKLATGQDAASLSVAPVLVSATNLHLTLDNALPCPQLGWVLYDFDNQPRAFVTTMGAHEINNTAGKLNPTPAGASLAVIPNPFRSDLQMIVSVSDNSKTSLSIYNMLGAKVADVAEENIPAGSQTYTFDASALPAGMYLCRMVVHCGGKTEVVVKRIVKDE